MFSDFNRRDSRFYFPRKKPATNFLHFSRSNHELSLIRDTFATNNTMFVSVLEKKAETKSGVSYERVDCNARDNASRRKVVIADQLAEQSVALGSHMRSAAMSSIPTGTFWYTNMAAVTS